MQGVSVDDAGLGVDGVSKADRFESLALAIRSLKAPAFTLNNISEGSLEVDWRPSQTESVIYNSSSSVGGASTSHSSSTPRSSPFVIRDLTLQNAADRESARGKMLPSFQDIVVNSDLSEMGSAGDGADFLGSNSGIMMGGFFCDLKNLSGGAPFQMDGSCRSPGVLLGSPSSSEALSVYETFLASTRENSCSAEDLYASDEFRMFEFKVRRCMRGRSHDWTECPFAHPGEKASRRDPCRFRYSGAACPDFKKGNCKKGEACEFSHGVFETWLHPARYRTQPCKDGRNCTRKTCFFAHNIDELRLLPAAAQAASAALRSVESYQAQLRTLKACAAQNGSCYGSFDGSSLMHNSFGDTFDGSNIYDRFGCLAHGLFDGSCSRHGGCHGGSPRFKVGAQRSSINCASHGGICSVSSQISSPTSTLVGISRSPPTLSPPLSPTESPPASPEDGQVTVSRTLPIAATRGGFSYNLSSPSQTTVSQVQGLVSRTQSNNSKATAAGTNISHTSSHLMTSVQRQHMDRLKSVPTLGIPNLGQRRLLEAFASAPSSPHSAIPTSSKASDLVYNLQPAELPNGANSIWLQIPSAQAPQMCPLYSSISSRPKMGELWEANAIEEDEVSMTRVESGRVLRAKIYGKLGKANRLDAVDSPDFGWVNELVEE
ncbi:hypothetical protein O6H91_01G044600 [Diphasiastrum complanatum]|uniref:Uncharacterized protein n=4 Tax=Diphasiastrum complanatum TaxID=34168 RepID=A0ACC2EQP2_DIPCM|nr:hypothetical protein O6H91_01G044600 [Diphasiastrum complanatum]KAJ7568703.1 hypothetical protein O6H91_01G044600 [Diphasiastrum complanatum]KAJ7568704.1 hypothetical protein O6H91_01G044600 [Diphasiastrum complanatum]KAJ7568705.1 hypothetical protein O6H91_01G044600 [Diphasiastrum complanatum]